MEEPLVSVIIPFYSGFKWLKEALNSVQDQTYKNMEVLVINDGSKENIDDIINMYNLNIKILYKENGGPASARNLGIERSSGKYIAFLDSDDLWLPDKLTKQIDFMETKKCVWSQHSYEMFWENSIKTKIINTKKYAGNVYKECFISFKVQTSCVVVLKSVLTENRIFFPPQKRYGQDIAFYKQIAKIYPLGYVNGVYTRFRIRGNNAGFTAKIQINDRTATWKEIKNDKRTLNMLPQPVIYAYKFVSIFNNHINQINKYVKNEIFIELISKLYYTLPYIVFKIYSKS